MPNEVICGGVRSPSFFIFFLGVANVVGIFESRGRKEIRSSFRFLWRLSSCSSLSVLLLACCCRRIVGKNRNVSGVLFPPLDWLVLQVRETKKNKRDAARPHLGVAWPANLVFFFSFLHVFFLLFLFLFFFTTHSRPLLLSLYTPSLARVAIQLSRVPCIVPESILRLMSVSVTTGKGLKRIKTLS